MKRYRFLLLVCLVALAAISSCKKDKNNTPYDSNITGVNLTAIDANPAGSIGTPDVNCITDNFRLTIYPNPSINIMNATVTINNKVPVTLKATLISVLYKNAPADAVVENAGMAGQVMLSQSKDLSAAAPPDTTGTGIGPVIPGQNALFTFDVGSLPRGFYRLYIETSAGEVYWDNAWLVR